jgi:hypothetical protein
VLAEEEDDDADASPPDFDEDPDESAVEEDDAAESLPDFDADGTAADESLLRLSVR